jgi:hypothetical protein
MFITGFTKAQPWLTSWRGPPSKANRHSASQEICSLSETLKSNTAPCNLSLESNPHNKFLFLSSSILMLSSHLAMVYQVVSFFQIPLLIFSSKLMWSQ